MTEFTWANVPGYFNFQDIYDQVVAEAPLDRESHFAEIGVLFGRSLFYLVDAVKKSGKPIMVDGIDPFYTGWRRKDLRQLFDRTMAATQPYEDLRCQEPVFFPPWYKLLGDAEERLAWGIANGVMDMAGGLGLSNLRLRTGRGQDFASGYANLDFVFIDAQHSYEDTLEILLAYLPAMRQNGIIAGHDLVCPDYPGVKQAVDQVFGGDYEVRGTSFVHRVKVSPALKK